MRDSVRRDKIWRAPPEDETVTHPGNPHGDDDDRAPRRRVLSRLARRLATAPDVRADPQHELRVLRDPVQLRAAAGQHEPDLPLPRRRRGKPAAALARRPDD